MCYRVRLLYDVCSSPFYSYDVHSKEMSHYWDLLLIKVNKILIYYPDAFDFLCSS